VTLGAAVTGFRTVAGAGIADGSVVSYAIQEGTNRETGTGVIGASGTTMTRVLRASSTGSLLNLTGSATVGIAANAGDFGLNLDSVLSPAPIVNNWAVLNAGPFGTKGIFGSALSSGVVYYMPFPLLRQIRISDLGARVVTSSAGGNFALAIYAHGTTRPSGVPLAATGNMSTASTGVVTASITGGSVTLEPGIYWSAIWQDNASAGYANIDTQLPNFFGVAIGSATANTVINQTAGSGISVASIETYNASAWPNATFETFFENANDNVNAIIIGKFS
jgi:hypothetical protein